MVSFEHKQLLKRIKEADRCPEEDDSYQRWRTGIGHVAILRSDARGNELIVTALSPVSFLHVAVVDANHPGLQDEAGLRDWNCTLFEHTAATRSWVIAGDDVHFEEVERHWGTPTLEDGWPLVYGRSFEGLDGPGSEYFEVAQPYLHHAEAHWRPERSAFCRFDRSGDWDDVVSISDSFDPNGLALVSFSRPALDEYLVEHHAVLVRLFDFTYRRLGKDIDWHPSEFTTQEMTAGLTFTQQVALNGSIAAVRGAQIIRPMLTEADVVHSIRNRWRNDGEPGEHVEFKVRDFRNDRVATVSTDRSTTTNYFATEGNSLPFEMSPAFFKPDVLSKYKADEDKYTVSESSIRCRGGWGLRSYSINEAGQVAVYIRDLRSLPLEEQKHWVIYNEEPRAGLSERAFVTDFLGQWPTDMTPREMLLDIVQKWRSRKVAWWRWRSGSSPDTRIVVPRTGSRNEWETALGHLYNDVVEGFSVKELRRILEEEGEEVDKLWKSRKLLERILQVRNALPQGKELVAIKALIGARNLGPAHSGGTRAREYPQEVLSEYETYAAHFEYLCKSLAEELVLIDQALTEQSGD